MKKEKKVDKEIDKEVDQEPNIIEDMIIFLLSFILFIIFFSIFKKSRYVEIISVVVMIVSYAVLHKICIPLIQKSKFGLFIRKYNVSKKLLYSLLILFVIQHSIVTKAPQCWLPIKEKDLLSNREKVIAHFDYNSIFDSYCFFEKKVLRQEYPYCSTQIIMQTRMSKPHFIDSERLYLNGALKDFRTIFLLGFLFDYDKLYDDLENYLEN